MGKGHRGNLITFLVSLHSLVLTELVASIINLETHVVGQQGALSHILIGTQCLEQIVEHAGGSDAGSLLDTVGQGGEK